MKSIFDSIKKSLQKPFVFQENKRFQFFLSLFIALIVFFILYILKPFGIENLDNNLFTYCLGYGIITLVVLSCYFFVVVPIFPVFFSHKTWNIGKEIITVLCCILIIGSISWYYNTLVQKGGHNPENFTFLSFLGYAFIISVFPVIIYVFFSEWYTRKNKTVKILEDNLDIQAETIKKNSDGSIKIFAENNKDFVLLRLSDFVYAASEGNYVSLFILENNKLKKNTIRRKLIAIEKELKSNKEIVRCHRSYLINTSYVKKVSGNARGYFLHFDEFEDEIPVSRKFNRSEIENFVKF